MERNFMAKKSNANQKVNNTDISKLPAMQKKNSHKGRKSIAEKLESRAEDILTKDLSHRSEASTRPPKKKKTSAVAQKTATAKTVAKTQDKKATPASVNKKTVKKAVKTTATKKTAVKKSTAKKTTSKNGGK